MTSAKFQQKMEKNKGAPISTFTDTENWVVTPYLVDSDNFIKNLMFLRDFVPAPSCQVSTINERETNL